MKQRIQKKWKRSGPILLFIVLILAIVCAFMPQILEIYDGPDSWIGRSSFDKGELLNFYAAFFTFLGTVILGTAAVFLSQQANDMNKRLLRIEENNYIPLIDINGITPEEVRDYALKDIFLLNLDDAHADITPDMEISPESRGGAIVLAMTNVSKTDIINIELHRLIIKTRYQNHKTVFSSFKNVSVSLNNKLPYSGTIPFIISGVHVEVPEDIPEEERSELGFTDPVIAFLFEFHSTNFLGETYIQRIKIDLVSPWEEPITYPAVENKRSILIS